MKNMQIIEKQQEFTKEIEKFMSPAFITTDIYEIEASSGDLSLLPKYHYKFKEEYLATHIIRPKNTEELSKIMRTCKEFSFPSTIRAAGTSCYSSSTPTRGGVVIDVRRMNRVHKVNEKDMIVRCDSGISWIHLIEELLDYGLAPKCYPTSYKSSCVSGFIASSGKAGIGTLANGNMKDALISVTMVLPDGSIEKVTKDSKGELSLDDITGSIGVYGAIAELEMSVTTLNTSMEMVGYSFKTIQKASEYYLSLKEGAQKPFFLSLSDKNFEKLSHKTIPSRAFFVYGVYYDDPAITTKSVSFANETAKKMDGLIVEDWYLKEKWNDIADTELNLARICKNPIFQEYWISDKNLEAFYKSYLSKVKKHDYGDAFYVMAGSDGRNRIKLFGLSDIADSREFFGIKAIFNQMTHAAYQEFQDSLYAIGVVNTFYFLEFNPEKVKYVKQLKEKLDPENLVNSYRFVKAKMKYWRIKLLFKVALFLWSAV